MLWHRACHRERHSQVDNTGTSARTKRGAIMTYLIIPLDAALYWQAGNIAMMIAWCIFGVLVGIRYGKRKDWT